ncbi:hypothetical protein RhiirA5_345723 [Rhizophagus irregularis]|uniref:Uncharacterized protein n=1 Tax=Rhizophagus irregularis TaxID=588596 RepID=A0A2N0QFM6_9GLOM|nr:hypothetical protein RhiirA5_345723 [Rhizophagus irregularis]
MDPPFRPHYFSILELESDRKFVFIDHPDHGQHRFPLPTKEEISKDYSYYSEPSKKKWINSFMIFRTYLQKSKQKQDYLVLGEVSKIASDAWSFAAPEVVDACGELEKKLKESFRYKRFVPYSSHNPKKPKKNKSPSKKESSSPYASASSRGQAYYPSPPMITTPPPMIATPIFSDLILAPSVYPSMYTPLATPLYIPFDASQMNMPSLTLPQSLSLEEMTSMFSDSLEQNPLSSLTPSQIFSGFDPNFLGNGFSSHSLQFPEERLTVINIPSNEAATESEVALTEAQSTWNFESSILPEEHQT